MAARLFGAPPLAAPLLGAAISFPILPWTRPAGRVPRLVAPLLVGLAGWTHAAATEAHRARDCRWGVRADSVDVVGFATGAESARRLRLQATAGLQGGCRGVIRAVLPAGAAMPDPGAVVRLHGVWRPELPGPRVDPVRAGTLLASRIETPASWAGMSPGVRFRRLALGLRARAARALERRLPSEAGLAAALVVAEREGLAPEVRESFVRAGLAHLLAISGFHVGVLALLATAGLGLLGLSRRRRAAGSACVAVAYAGLLGFPHAATRAALLVALLALGRMLDRPVLPAGALSSALLLLLLVEPAALGATGFQLSFAGAFGLAVWAPPLKARLTTWLRRLTTWLRRLSPNDAGAVRPGAARALTGILDGVVAALAATLLTAPLVAWHFEAIPAFGLPATLVAGPLVALALPGLLLVVVLELAGLPGAGVPAAGAEGLLWALRRAAEAFSKLPGATIPVTRPEVVAALFGAGVAVTWLTRVRRVGPAVRMAALVAGCATSLALLPVLDAHLRDGSLEMHVIDVGQGDALAVRTPRGRWLVIDAGPAPGDRLVRELRRLGVREIDVLVLTHPDLDHIGGAPAIFAAVPVRTVWSPGTVRGSDALLEALASARTAHARWSIVERGLRRVIDGLEVRVVWPGAGDPVARLDSDADPNAHSVVVTLAWAGFRALLTADAPLAAENIFAREVGPVNVLKVGHHGSRTSTGAALLDAVRPVVAVISVGRFNRFGHPAPSVLARLHGAGVEVHRTDREGTIRVRVERDGHWEVRSARAYAARTRR